MDESKYGKEVTLDMVYPPELELEEVRRERGLQFNLKPLPLSEQYKKDLKKPAKYSELMKELGL